MRHFAFRNLRAHFAVTTVVCVTLLTLVFSSLSTQGEAHAATVRLAYLDSADNRRVVEALQDSFEAAYIGADVELVPVSSGEAQRMLPLWLATGEIADVFYLPVEYVGALKGNRLLKPLDTLRWPGAPLSDLFSRFPPGIQVAFAEGSVPIGIPLTASASVLQYNADLLANAGVPPLAPLSTEWTWYDLIDIGRAVSMPDRGRYLVDIDLEFAGVYFMVHGNVVSPDGRRSTVLNDANIQILELAQESIHGHRISLPPSGQSNARRRFLTGSLAIYRTSAFNMHPARVAEEQSSVPFDWEVALMPRSPFGGGRPALGQGAGLVVAWAARSLPDVSQLLDHAARAEVQLEIAERAMTIPAQSSALGAMWTGAAHTGELVAHLLADWQFFNFPVVIVQDVEALLAPVQAALENRLHADEAIGRVHLEFQRALDLAYQ